MKKIKLIIILFCFHWSGIVAQTTGATGTTSAPAKKMKTKKSPAKYVISGEVTESFKYCGGARPSEKILAERKTPRPFVNKVFHIRKGNTNTLKKPILLSFTTDTNGYFSFALPPGTYSIIQTDQVKKLNTKKYKINYIDVDETCLINWWAEPYAILEIKNENIAALKFHFEHSCFLEGDVPCRKYKGPMPQ